MADTPRRLLSSGRVRCAVCMTFAGLLGGWALWFSTTNCVRVWRDTADVSPPLAEVMDQRLEPARTVLQDTRSVRYVQNEENYDPVTAKGRRAIAGYALVPVLVTDDPSEELILADFADDPSLAAYMRAQPVTLIEHLGPGLGILRVNRP